MTPLLLMKLLISTCLSECRLFAQERVTLENLKHEGTSLSFLLSIYFLLSFSLWTGEPPDNSNVYLAILPHSSARSVMARGRQE
jgi:hypothetical protein